MKKVLIAIVLCLSVIALAGCTAGVVNQQEEVKVTRGDIAQGVKSDGELASTETRNLGFGTSGRIEEVTVVEGDRVSKGKVLARLEMSPLERAVKTAELAVRSAETDLQQAQENVKLAQIDLEVATDNYRKLTYPYTFATFSLDIPQALDFINTAQRKLEEAQKNLQVGLTQGQYGDIARQMKESQDNLTSARERLARGQGTEVIGPGLITARDFFTLRAAQLGMERAGIAVEVAGSLASKAALAVDRAKYDRDSAKEQLDKAVITAPFDGTISVVNLKVGDSLATLDFTKPILEIIDTLHMELQIDVDEIDIPSVRVGQEARITVEALPTLKLSGKVTRIAPAPKIEAGVVLYEVKVDFDVPEGSELRAGMSASANIVLEQKTGVLVLPNRAIARDREGSAVVKVKVGNELQEKKVATGISDSFYTEIVSGLQEGDTAVIERRTGS